MNANFFGDKDDLGALSPFSNHPVTHDGKVYPTCEHLFQCAKFWTTKPEWSEKIRAVPAAKVRKASITMGRDRSKPLRPGWDFCSNKIKTIVCLWANLLKFSQNAEAWEVLNSTGDDTLVFRTHGDMYWGVGDFNTGLNVFGIILMKVRTIIREGTVNDALDGIRREYQAMCLEEASLVQNLRLRGHGELSWTKNFA